MNEKTGYQPEDINNQTDQAQENEPTREEKIEALLKKMYEAKNRAEALITIQQIKQMGVETFLVDKMGQKVERRFDKIEQDLRSPEANQALDLLTYDSVVRYLQTTGLSNVSQRIIKNQWYSSHPR